MRFVRRTSILLRCDNPVVADALLGRFLPRLGPLASLQAASFFSGHPYSAAARVVPEWPDGDIRGERRDEHSTNPRDRIETLRFGEVRLIHVKPAIYLDLHRVEYY